MRTLNRNKRELYYALYLSETEDTNANGDLTGEISPDYGNVTRLDCNISAAVGSEVISAFGEFTNYSRAIVVSDITCPIDENSLIWFGVETTEPHNYIVTKKADSKNGLMYALKEVRVR